MEDETLKRLVLSEQDRERLELLQRANEKKGTQLRVDIDKGSLSEFDEIKEMIGKDFENPEEKYKIYYTGIRNILIKYLPKGPACKEGRDLIYDEKNIFLNLGKRKSDNKGIRKSDGRMTYQPIMNEMLDVILKWVSESLDPMELHSMLWELNERNGYGHEIYDKTSEQYNRSKRRIAKAQ